jgi:hypothetical protein
MDIYNIKLSMQFCAREDNNARVDPKKDSRETGGGLPANPPFSSGKNGPDPPTPMQGGFPETPLPPSGPIHPP